ncbi:MAG: hypothetical protein IRY89_13270 [Pseudolabrys sp.]|nr:hypothetical protein [Pseudolabrys sp.]
MSSHSVQMLLSLAIGFSFAGLSCSGFRLATNRLPSFSMLSRGPSLAALASVPLLIIAAPFLILRHALLAGEDRPRFEFAFLATLIAGFWSLMSGLTLIAALQACGLIAA